MQADLDTKAAYFCNYSRVDGNPQKYFNLSDHPQMCYLQSTDRESGGVEARPGRDERRAQIRGLASSLRCMQHVGIRECRPEVSWYSPGMARFWITAR